MTYLKQNPYIPFGITEKFLFSLSSLVSIFLLLLSMTFIPASFNPQSIFDFFKEDALAIRATFSLMFVVEISFTLIGGSKKENEATWIAPIVLSVLQIAVFMSVLYHY